MIERKEKVERKKKPFLFTEEEELDSSVIDRELWPIIEAKGDE